MKQSHYLIKQTLPHIEPNIIKIFEPTNITHVKQLISTLIGEIFVYHYNSKNNSRIDLTSTFGRTGWNIMDHSFEKIHIAVYLFISKKGSRRYIKTFTLQDNTNQTINKTFFMSNQVHFLNSTNYTMDINRSIFFSDIEQHKKNKTYGNQYEEYIAAKYQENNYTVTLNGIKKAYNDGGIDLIAVQNDTIILVQCKNWSLSNEYKINQKDLRAFIGDCYLYIKENSISNKSMGFHFIVSHENILTKSAEIFLQKNTFIKFKCIPFEEG